MVQYFLLFFSPRSSRSTRSFTKQDVKYHFLSSWWLIFFVHSIRKSSPLRGDSTTQNSTLKIQNYLFFLCALCGGFLRVVLLRIFAGLTTPVGFFQLPFTDSNRIRANLNKLAGLNVFHRRLKRHLPGWPDFS